MRSAQQSLHRLFSSSLESALSPLWKISQFGLLLPWCHSSTKKSSYLLHALQYIGVGITVFITIIFTVFRTFQMIMIVKKENTTMQDITSYFIWCFPPYVALVGEIDYLLRRRHYLSFFQDWNARFNGISTGNLRTTIVIYTVYFGAVSGLFIFMSWAIIFPSSREGRAKHMSDYPELTKIFTTFVLKACTLISIGVSCFFLLLADIVPSFVYYHAGRLLQILESRLSEKVLLKREDVQHTWISYDNVCRIVSRGDNLLGPQVIFHQGCSFTMICIFLFTLINSRNIGLDPSAILRQIGFCLILTFRLLWTILMITRLNQSSENLRSTVASIVSRCVIDVPAAKTLRCFLSRLEHDHLAACPLGLYKITHSIFLTMLSLTVTYTVILFQSN